MEGRNGRDAGHQDAPTPCYPLIRPSDAADDSRIIAIYNGIEWDFPPVEVAEYRRHAEAGRTGGYFEQWVAEIHGEVCGYSVLSASPPAQRRGRYLGSIRVRADTAGRGIGHRLYELLVDRARECGASSLYGWVRQDLPASRSFVERRGFSPTGRCHRFARLHTASAHLYRKDASCDALQRGMAIKTLDGLQNREEVVLHALHAVSSRAGVGPDGAASGAALPYDIWLREIESTGGSSESTWVTIDRSRPVALTWLRRHGEQSAFYEQVGNLEGEMGRAAERALTMEAATWAHLHGILWLYMRGDAVHLQPLDADRLRYTPLAPKVEMVKHLPREMLRHLSL